MDLSLITMTRLRTSPPLPDRIPREPGLYFTIEALGPVAIVLVHFFKSSEIEEIFRKYDIYLPHLDPLHDVNIIQEKFLFLIHTEEKKKLARILLEFIGLAVEKNEPWKPHLMQMMTESLAQCFIKLRYHLSQNVYQLVALNNYELKSLRERKAFRRKFEKQKVPIKPKAIKAKPKVNQIEHADGSGDLVYPIYEKGIIKLGSKKCEIPPDAGNQLAICDDLFERAQRQLKENAHLSRRNRKNDYLLAGKIRCACGCTRGGEGPQKGRYTYYRCNGRQYSYPLPPTCTERGINSRIADDLVRKKITQIMSSPELMRKQAKRWAESRDKQSSGSLADTTAIKKEIVKLKEEESRYSKAHGAGLFSIEQLQEYTTPVKEQIKNFESQVAKARVVGDQSNEPALPEQHEIEAFAEKATRVLCDLNFEAKRAIVMSVVDTIIGTPQELKVSGYLPVTDYVESQPSNSHEANANPLNHVKFKTNDRHRRATERRQVDAF